MLDLVGNPEDRFSHDVALMMPGAENICEGHGQIHVAFNFFEKQISNFLSGMLIPDF